MSTVLQTVVLVCASLLFLGMITITVRYRRLLDEIEYIRLEQQKLNFRLFMVEKKQKIYQETKAS